MKKIISLISLIKKIKITFFLVFVMFIIISLSSISGLELQSEKEKDKNNEKDKELKINSAMFFNKLLEVIPTENNIQPSTINLDNKAYKIEYTLDFPLTKYINNLLSKYRPDYAAVVVIDNNTGKIISATGFRKVGNKIVPSLAFSNTNPCASLFKIITAADLLQEHRVNPETIFTYVGKSTTLYNSQLKERKNKQGRPQTFKKAFAVSNNVIFGKAALQYCSSKELYDMAYKFGFNQDLLDEIGLSRSITETPSMENNFVLASNRNLEQNAQNGLAALASGFNTETKITPIHAAVLASIMANDGILIYPSIISKVTDQDGGINLWKKIPRESRVIDAKVAQELKEMMELTVDEGTARRSFRKLHPAFNNELIIGGKSGSITGGIPDGKRNWFIAFAIPKNPSLGKGISISVMNVDIKGLRVKSAYLARNIIEFYFRGSLIGPQKITYGHKKHKLSKKVRKI
ncbi:MAG: hypothetical protein HQK51_02690 [Oligoflexia bacterium]|nr:hypothetical protein [Oligoflexia bacterium]